MESKFSVKDRILSELRKNGNVGEVRKSCRSMSLFSECLNKYVDEQVTEVEALNEERDKLKASVTRLRKENNSLEESNSILSADNERLVSYNQKLTDEVEQKSSKVKGFDAKLESLASKEISFGMLEKIAVLAQESGDKLLVQLENLKNRNSVEEECDNLEKKKDRLERKVKRLENNSERLDKRITVKEDQLETVNDRIVESEAKFNSIKNKVIGSINETKDSGVAGIKKIAENVRLNEKAVFDDAVKNVEAFADEVVDKIDGIGVVTEDRIRRASQKTIDTLDYVEKRFLGLAESFREGLGEYSEFQKMSGELGDNILYGKAFLNMTSDFEILKRIPPLGVANILDRCLLWNKVNYPGSTVKATAIFPQMDGGLFPSWPYKTEVLLMLVSEGFRKLKDGST